MIQAKKENLDLIKLLVSDVNDDKRFTDDLIEYFYLKYGNVEFKNFEKDKILREKLNDLRRFILTNY